VKHAAPAIDSISWYLATLSKAQNVCGFQTARHREELCLLYFLNRSGQSRWLALELLSGEQVCKIDQAFVLHFLLSRFSSPYQKNSAFFFIIFEFEIFTQKEISSQGYMA
jgi:hypothetical protein